MARIKGSTNRKTTRSYTSVDDMANDVRGVLKSIIRQDGRYTTKEAGVVGKIYGAELSRMKLQVEIHKMNTKVASKVVSADKVLTLN